MTNFKKLVLISHFYLLNYVQLCLITESISALAISLLMFPNAYVFHSLPVNV